MISITHHSFAKAMLMLSAGLSVAACSSGGSYRLGSIGTVPGGGDTAGNPGSGGNGGDQMAGGDMPGSGTPGNGTPGSGTPGGGNTGGGQTQLGGGVLVSAGNAVIGLAGKHNELAEQVNGAVPIAAPVTGTVTAVLKDTGQTLVDLGNGKTVALASAAGIVGEIVKVDLGSKTVISAPDNSSLLGVGLLSPNPVTGTLASVNLGTGAPGAANGALGPVQNVAQGVVGTVTNVAANPTGLVTTAANTVTGTVAGLTGEHNPLGGVTGTGGGANPVGNVVGAVTGAVSGTSGTANPVGGVVSTVTNVVGGVTGTGSNGGNGLLGGLLGKKGK